MTTAPQWREPTDDMPDGWYWVEMLDVPANLYQEGTDEREWVIEFIATNPRTLVSEIHWQPLGNRRVAPCTGRPE